MSNIMKLPNQSKKMVSKKDYERRQPPMVDDVQKTRQEL
jgi:hypothetical protein